MNVSRETLRELGFGVRDMWLVGLGVVPLGLAFGLLMVQSGFAWWWTPVFSMLIYAGSTEFLAIPMVLGGVGPASAAMTGFMVNFRHLFYGLTYPRDAIRSTFGRLYSMYSLTDEVYAVISARQQTTRYTGPRLIAIHMMCQALWVVSGLVGALASERLPGTIEGMDFALTALFIVLAYEAFQASRDMSAVLIAAGIALVAAFVVPGQMLMVALIAYFLVLLVRFWVPGVDKRLEWKR